jgi:hypothetical protein
VVCGRETSARGEPARLSCRSRSVLPETGKDTAAARGTSLPSTARILGQTHPWAGWPWPSWPGCWRSRERHPGPGRVTAVYVLLDRFRCQTAICSSTQGSASDLREPRLDREGIPTWERGFVALRAMDAAAIAICGPGPRPGTSSAAPTRPAPVRSAWLGHTDHMSTAGGAPAIAG